MDFLMRGAVEEWDLLLRVRLAKQGIMGSNPTLQLDE